MKRDSVNLSGKKYQITFINEPNQMNVKTMSSIELVKIINDMREGGAAVLVHSDFLKKVVKVLGEEVAGKFSCYYKAENGKQNPCYALPKRESHLMVMSESYKVQAAVYDRMTELEAKVIEPPTAPPTGTTKLAPIKDEFVVALEFAKIWGLSENQALLSANKMVKQVTDFDVMAAMGNQVMHRTLFYIVNPQTRE